MRRRIGSRLRYAACAAAVVIALVAVMYVVSYVSDREKLPEGTKKVEPGKTKAPGKKIPPVKPVSPVTKKRVAIVIDDVGYDAAIVKKILKLDAPVTIAVLPSCPYSTWAARDAHRAGREIILHLPMEPNEYPGKNPGKGVLLVSMNHAEIERQLEKNLLSVPFARGVNNHMGSRFMEDEDKVRTVMKYLKHKDLFFLDSMTTRNTQGVRVAKQIGVRCNARDIFIDNEGSYDDTVTILRRIADRNDWHALILIGHAHDTTIDALRHVLPLFKDRGITIVPLSHIVG